MKRGIMIKLRFFFLICCVTVPAYVLFLSSKSNPNILLDELLTRHSLVTEQAHFLLESDLVDPEQSPFIERDSVLRGYHILMNTPLYASKYVGDNLSCTNCHFAEGDTLGGKNNGISLVGVINQYPQYSKREGKTISLADRINNCFERSMNGRPVPKDSQEMHDMINYLTWISKEVAHFKSMPWLGMSLLRSKHTPDSEEGGKIYQASCSLCHHSDGLGSQTVPPLWGNSSFNDGAGMSKLPMLSAFVYWNMPYGEASLSEEQALDVASFILQQPRAHFTPP